MLIEPRGAGFRAGIKGQIIGPHGFPIVGAFVKRFDVEIRVARRVALGLDDGIEIGLARAAAHRSQRGVDDIGAGVRGFQHCGGIDAAGVVRVKVHGDGNFFAERFDKFVSRIRFAESRHVFDRKKMRAEFSELPGHSDVIFQ